MSNVIVKMSKHMAMYHTPLSHVVRKDHVSWVQEARSTLLKQVLQQWHNAGLLQSHDSALHFAAFPPLTTLRTLPTARQRTQLPFAPSYLTDDDRAALPCGRCSLPIRIVQCSREAAGAVRHIVAATKQATALPERIIGFDIEWRPCFDGKTKQPPPAVVQVCRSRRRDDLGHVTLPTMLVFDGIACRNQGLSHLWSSSVHGAKTHPRHACCADCHSTRGAGMSVDCVPCRPYFAARSQARAHAPQAVVAEALAGGPCCRQVWRWTRR